MALTLTSILSLLLTLIEGARIGAIKMQGELAAETSMESALSEFHRELLKQYDLLFIDVSYGTGNYSEEALTEHLTACAEKNLSRGGLSFPEKKTFTGTGEAEVSVTGTRYAADNGAQALLEQVYAYMSADPAEEIAGEALGIIEGWKGSEINVDEWKRKKQEIGRDADEALDLSHKRFEDLRSRFIQNNSSGNSANVPDKEGEANSDKRTGFVRSLRNILNDASLSWIYGESGSLSDAAVSRSDYISMRDFHTGSSLAVQNTHHYREADQLSFDEYILEKCGTLLTGNGGSALKYETEYILFGGETDKDNLTGMMTSLLLVREAANAAYIFRDGAKCAEAESLAAGVCTLLLIPECTEAVKSLILAAWACAESESDVKTLMKGGRVPLMKTSSDWKTKMWDILLRPAAYKGGEGLSYQDYLRIFLFLENQEQAAFRLMDVMEMNIRATDGNSGFRMDWCLDSFSADFTVESSSGHRFRFSKEISYN